MSVGWKQIITSDDIHTYLGGDNTVTVDINPSAVAPFAGVWNVNNNKLQR